MNSLNHENGSCVTPWSVYKISYQVFWRKQHHNNKIWMRYVSWEVIQRSNPATHNIVPADRVKRYVVIAASRSPYQLQPGGAALRFASRGRISSSKAAVYPHDFVDRWFRARPSSGKSENLNILGSPAIDFQTGCLTLCWSLSGLPLIFYQFRLLPPAFAGAPLHSHPSSRGTSCADPLVLVAASGKRGRRGELCWASFGRTSPTASEREKIRKKERKNF